MKPLPSLLAKELRLALPAFASACLLAVAPVWLTAQYNAQETPVLSLCPFYMGAAILALCAFGRELSLGTFPLLLAQPLERARLWWAKIGVLALAMLAILGAWSLACAAWLEPVPQPMTGQPSAPMALVGWEQFLPAAAVGAAVAFAGGLWTTLLLRHVVAGFWLTLLVPTGILGLIWNNEGSGRLMYAALILYALAGFFWAWWQFVRAQEGAWTGGVVTLPGWPSTVTTPRRILRARRPLAALAWKEIQLQQVSLLGMGCLFLTHLGIMAWLKARPALQGSSLHAFLHMFALVWVTVPVLVGTSSVAEERKLGTLEGQACLPVSRNVQFVLKLLLVVLVGGLLSATLLWTAEGIGARFGADSLFGGSGTRPVAPALKNLSRVFLVVALVGFHASTLSRNVLQALTVGALSGLLLGVLLVSADNHLVLFRVWWPVLAAGLLWLAWRNFRRLGDVRQLWWRNALALAGFLLLILIVNSRLVA